MSIQINRITNAVVYVDGNSLLGTVAEATLPTIKHKMAEHQALGMVGVAEFFSGIEKLEAKLKWNSFYRSALVQAGNPMKSVNLQIRGSLESWEGGDKEGEVPIVMYLTAVYKDFPMGTFKQSDNVELESNLTVYTAKMEIDGQPVIEFDVLANIYKVEGVDMLATYKANLGI